MRVDATDFAETVHGLDPEETLFIICSKTFTTLETMTNANAARDWVIERLGEAAVARFRGIGGSCLFLESDTSLAPALALYESLGFKRCSRPVPSEYSRCDTYMEFRS